MVLGNIKKYFTPRSLHDASYLFQNANMKDTVAVNQNTKTNLQSKI